MRISDWSSDVCSSDLVRRNALLLDDTRPLAKPLLQLRPIILARRDREAKVRNALTSVVSETSIFVITHERAIPGALLDGRGASAEARGCRVLVPLQRVDLPVHQRSVAVRIIARGRLGRGLLDRKSTRLNTL